MGYIEEILKLSKLKDDGILTEEEFQRKKDEILSHRPQTDENDEVEEKQGPVEGFLTNMLKRRTKKALSMISTEGHKESINAIKELEDLEKDGIITKQELEKRKNKIIWSSNNPALLQASLNTSRSLDNLEKGLDEVDRYDTVVEEWIKKLKGDKRGGIVYSLDARLELRDFSKKFITCDWNHLPTNESTTIGELLINLVGKIPEEKEVIKIEHKCPWWNTTTKKWNVSSDNWEFTILKKGGNELKKIKWGKYNYPDWEKDATIYKLGVSIETAKAWIETSGNNAQRRLIDYR